MTVGSRDSRLIKRRDVMYGNPGMGAGVAPTVAGVSVLPATGNSTLLFTVAVSLIATGVAIMIASAVVARKSRTSAN
jgi:predicted phage tail protein